ncbi:hypothetical protein [Thalassospira povalilytica]
MDAVQSLVGIIIGFAIIVFLILTLLVFNTRAAMQPIRKWNDNEIERGN